MGLSFDSASQQIVEAIPKLNLTDGLKSSTPNPNPCNVEFSITPFGLSANAALDVMPRRDQSTINKVPMMGV